MSVQNVNQVIVLIERLKAMEKKLAESIVDDYYKSNYYDLNSSNSFTIKFTAIRIWNPTDKQSKTINVPIDEKTAIFFYTQYLNSLIADIHKLKTKISQIQIIGVDKYN